MRINCKLLAVVIIASIIFSHVTADSEDVSKDTKNQGRNDNGKEIIDPAKKAKEIKVSKGDSNVPVDPKGEESKKKKENGSDPKDGEEKKNLDSEQKKEPKKERLPPSREKCDSTSDICKDKDETWIACLRVPGNDSPALSLLIQNKGKGFRRIKISAPDMVELKKKQIDLQENEDMEVKVSISGLESGHFIEFTADNGNCRLDFTTQYMALKKVDNSSNSSHFSIFELTLSTGFLVLAVLVAAVASVFLYPKLKKSFSPGKGPKYQKLDAAELPISHGSKVENKDWDDSWGDNWDDEEAPLTPSMPITPSLSSKGMASRKFNKDSWND